MSTNRPLLSTWTQSALVVVLVAASSVGVWSLIEQNQQLKAALRSGVADRSDSPHGYEEGDSLDEIGSVEFVGSTHAGTVRLRELISGKAGVLAFLTTTCPYCVDTLPAWGELAARLERDGIPFTALSLHGRARTERYRETHGVEWPIFSIATVRDLTRFSLAGVPTTVVHTPGGRVTGVWTGVLTHADIVTIRTAVGEAVISDQSISAGGSW